MPCSYLNSPHFQQNKTSLHLSPSVLQSVCVCLVQPPLLFEVKTFTHVSHVSLKLVQTHVPLCFCHLSLPFHTFFLPLVFLLQQDKSWLLAAPKFSPDIPRQPLLSAVPVRLSLLGFLTLPLSKMEKRYRSILVHICASMGTDWTDRSNMSQSLLISF